jgi:hypothetical protein
VGMYKYLHSSVFMLQMRNMLSKCQLFTFHLDILSITWLHIDCIDITSNHQLRVAVFALYDLDKPSVVAEITLACHHPIVFCIMAEEALLICFVISRH